jgi:hypothetical protein
MKEDKIMFEAKFDGQLFKVPEVKQSASTTYEFWHQPLGHTNLDPKLYDIKLPPKPDDFHCESCTEAKLTKSPCPTTVNKNRKKFDLIHSDLSGPFSVSSYGRSLYYITLIDDATRYSWVKFLKKKSSTTQILMDFIAEIELQYNMTPKSFRTNNDGEYISNELNDHLRQKGTVHQYTPPYSPESNGVAERLN